MKCLAVQNQVIQGSKNEGIYKKFNREWSVREVFRMKGSYTCYRVIILCLVFTFPLFVLPDPLMSKETSALSSDPFLGEGKQGYIARCVSTPNTGLPIAERKRYCRCIANKTEKEYAAALESIKPSDTVALAQQKMNNVAKRIQRACMVK